MRFVFARAWLDHGRIALQWGLDRAFLHEFCSDRLFSQMFGSLGLRQSYCG